MCGFFSLISLIFVFCNIIVECAALYLKYSGFLPRLSDAPQLVMIFSPYALNSNARVPALKLLDTLFEFG